MHTIAAIATRQGRAALAVIRVSGPLAHPIVSQCLRGNHQLSNVKAREIHLYNVVDPGDGEAVDQVTAVKYCAPASFTGEDMAEIVCHGGETVPRLILQAVTRAGATHAGPGEFTRRAVENGKIGLLRAEAIAELVDSRSRAGQRNALRSYLGGYDELFCRWREVIVDTLSLVEADIEFGEEEDVRQRSVRRGGIRQRLKTLGDGIEKELSSRRGVRKVESGLRVAIVGPRNAGKSSLFNAMVGGERSIVHPVAGTTRDFVSEPLVIGGSQVSLVDTAGLGGSEDAVEGIGMERTRALASASDLLVWVTPADRPLDAADREVLSLADGRNMVGVISKTDLCGPESKQEVMGSRDVAAYAGCLIDEGQSLEAVAFLNAGIEHMVEGWGGESAIVSQRQEGIAKRLLQKVVDAAEGVGEEIVAAHLGEALESFEEFSGRVGSEEVMDRIFSRFCVGK